MVFEQLKQKYAPVLDFIKQANVSLAHLHEDSGKLVIQGRAPSEKTKNLVWDKIKQIDPSYSDLACDLTVDSSIPEATGMGAGAASGAGQAAGGGMQSYTVKAGDSLWKIAQNLMGNGSLYPKIVAANPDKLQDEHTVIHPGDVLKVPSA